MTKNKEIEINESKIYSPFGRHAEWAKYVSLYRNSVTEIYYVGICI